jgi:hypothetical protein
MARTRVGKPRDPEPDWKSGEALVALGLIVAIAAVWLAIMRHGL